MPFLTNQTDSASNGVSTRLCLTPKFEMSVALIFRHLNRCLSALEPPSLGLSRLQNALRILLVRFRARLHLKRHTLIDEELAIFGDRYLESIERSWCRPLEVQTAFVITAAVTWAFELIFSLEPIRRATEMGALGEERVKAFILTHDPHTIVLLEFIADLASRVIGRKSGFECGRRLKAQTLRFTQAQADGREYRSAEREGTL